ncbi:MAG: permease [Candidatus Bipolaricaulota bacterium]|nr:permease [Candidatus Bipolaricaulota bacterium]
MLDVIWQILFASWQMLGQMAPFLLLGFLIAGVLSVGMSAEWLQRHLGRGGIKPVIKATLLGVPLPLCSCGVIPVAASMRRHGASRAATTAFLLSTPQTGIDSILVTYSLLGGAFAIFRPLAALVTGIIGGIMVMLMGKDHAGANPPKNRVLTPRAGEHTDRSIPIQILRYGFVTLPREIGPALIVGILIAGAMSALVPVGEVSAYIGGGIVSILIMMAAGVPMYVCATASVPIAAGLLHVGVSFGAVFAFLIAGPATNAATLTTLWKVLGRRTTLIFLATIAASAIGFGLLLNALVPMASQTLPQLAAVPHIHGGGLLQNVMAALLLALLVVSRLLRSNKKKLVSLQGVAEEHLELRVSGMHCNHCVAAIDDAVRSCPGVSDVNIDLKTGSVQVHGKEIDEEQVVSAIGALGYTVSRLS